MILSQQQIEVVTASASAALLSYCQEYGIHHTVTGVSGGLDSSVTLALSQLAVEKARAVGYSLSSLGLILPCQSDPEHAVLGKKVIRHFGAELLEVDLTGIFELLEKNILKPVANALSQDREHPPDQRYRTAQGNVKARLRMSLGTYYVANLVNGLVLSTDNCSEYWMGFWTLHGDVGDFGMIQELWKGSELIQLARHLGVPEDVIAAAPTDGLGVQDGGDEAQMGATYPVVDRIIQELQKHGIDLNGSPAQLEQLPELAGLDADLVRKIASRAIGSGFKRKHPRNLSRGELGL
ncbi:MAG: NAD(+) synthase [bacterium]|nr:NAD(+) synthase [bacterium]